MSSLKEMPLRINFIDCRSESLSSRGCRSCTFIPDSYLHAIQF